MKILVILVYYDRPNMVRFALDSVAEQSYRNYSLAIIDDGSAISAWDIVHEHYFGKFPSTVLYRTDDSIEDKIAQGGSRHGEQINYAIMDSDADVAILLCDDDAIYPGYLEGLAKYYSDNPSVNYSFGHVQTFNPYEAEDYNHIVGNPIVFLNNHFYPINPYCQVDASQVSWRLDAYREAGIEFPSPQTSALDADVYRQMYSAWGPCEFNGLTTQYKGWFEDQMGNRSDMFRPRDRGVYGTS